MKTDTECKPDNLALTYAAWLTRLWLAVRAIQTGVEKFAGTEKMSEAVMIDGEPNKYGMQMETVDKFYALSNYHGVPAAMADQFGKEPLIPGFFLKFYDMLLGPALLVLGLTILLGIASRTSLFLLGALYISLTWGLILLGEPGNAGVAWLAAHMILIVWALYLAPYNKLCVLKKW
jgi:thiosulfate dehydrogenase [quinone] large subunit